MLQIETVKFIFHILGRFKNRKMKDTEISYLFGLLKNFMAYPKKYEIPKNENNSTMFPKEVKQKL